MLDVKLKEPTCRNQGSVLGGAEATRCRIRSIFLDEVHTIRYLEQNGAK